MTAHLDLQNYKPIQIPQVVIGNLNTTPSPPATKSEERERDSAALTNLSYKSHSFVETTCYPQEKDDDYLIRHNDGLMNSSSSSSYAPSTSKLHVNMMSAFNDVYEIPELDEESEGFSNRVHHPNPSIPLSEKLDMTQLKLDLTRIIKPKGQI